MIPTILGVFSLQGNSLVLRDLSQLSTTIEAINLTLLEVREFSLTIALLSSWRFFYHWLNLRRVFGRYSIGSLWLVLPFCSSSTPIGMCLDDQLIDDFCASSVGAICREWVISRLVVSETKSCMVQMRLMATTNQETGNPPNALERQVQTLATAVERLTQWNHELER